MASLFSDEAPLAPPSTALAGFLRFLLLLCGHDWAAAPLVVDPQGELNATDKAAVGEAFSRSRDRGEQKREFASIYWYDVLVFVPVCAGVRTSMYW